MNFRKITIGLVALALIGSIGAAAQVPNVNEGDTARSADFFGLFESPDGEDQVVEGHTVYTELENRKNKFNPQAAVVVNVQNVTSNQGEVLWFDDSFLHQVGAAGTGPACGGSVWATHDDGVLLSDRSNYVPDKTYNIQDPENAVTWVVTEYEHPPNVVSESAADDDLTRAWAVEIQTDTRNGPDDCTAYTADGTGGGSGDGSLDTYPGPNGGDDTTPSDVSALEYNALLWFEFGSGHLEADGSVQFGCNNVDEGDGDGTNDHNVDTPCGAQAESHDTTEGNSHPYNYEESTEADGGEPAPIHNHTTAQISLYYLEDQGLATSDNTFDNTPGGFHEHGDE